MQDAFAQQLQEYMPRLRRYARAITRDRARADDLVQETLLQAWSSRDRIKLGPGFRALLCKILHDKHVDEIRRAAHQREWAENAAAVASRNAGQDFDPLDVRRAFARLPPKSQEVLRMAFERMSYLEMAAALGVGEEAVSSRLDRSRQQFRQLLGEPDKHPLKKKITPEERERLVERLAVVRCAAEVAREFGRHPNAVWRLAVQEGVELSAGYAIRGHRTGRIDLRRAGHAVFTNG